MTYRQLREIGIVMALTATLIALSGCAWNPLQPPPGGVSFKVSADCSIAYENTGRDIDSASGEFSCPTGAKGKFRVAGSRGSASADNSVNAQAQLNALLIAMLGSKIPNLGAILAAGGMPVPPVP